jgi:hypothetical protein
MRGNSPVRFGKGRLETCVSQSCPSRDATNASNVGAHVRHCLDHVEALLAGPADGAVDYREAVRLDQAVCACEDAIPPDVPENLVRAILSATPRR